jgi:hypothetical protein
MNHDLEKLARLSQAELDQLFTKNSAGEVPNGRFDGIFLVAPGTVLTAAAAALIDYLFWQGKVFDVPRARVNNIILPFGLELVQAKITKGASRFDGKECIILDYSTTSLAARWVRDEIREIEPAVYLGKFYFGAVRMPDFALARG